MKYIDVYRMTKQASPFGWFGRQADNLANYVARKGQEAGDAFRNTFSSASTPGTEALDLPLSPQEQEKAKAQVAAQNGIMRLKDPATGNYVQMPIPKQYHYQPYVDQQFGPIGYKVENVTPQYKEFEDVVNKMKAGDKTAYQNYRTALNQRQQQILQQQAQQDAARQARQQTNAAKLNDIAAKSKARWNAVRKSPGTEQTPISVAQGNPQDRYARLRRYQQQLATRNSTFNRATLPQQSPEEVASRQALAQGMANQMAAREEYRQANQQMNLANTINRPIAPGLPSPQQPQATNGQQLARSVFNPTGPAGNVAPPNPARSRTKALADAGKQQFKDQGTANAQPGKGVAPSAPPNPQNQSVANTQPSANPAKAQQPWKPSATKRYSVNPDGSVKYDGITMSLAQAQKMDANRSAARATGEKINTQYAQKHPTPPSVPDYRPKGANGQLAKGFWKQVDGGWVFQKPGQDINTSPQGIASKAPALARQLPRRRVGGGVDPLIAASRRRRALRSAKGNAAV